MLPPLLIWLNFDFSMLLLVPGDHGLGVRVLCVGTVNALKEPALSDRVTSKGIELLGITET